MAAGQPEATPPITAADTEPEFPTVWRGFEPEQVRARLAGLTERIGRLESELARTRRLLEDARRERDAARSRGGSGTHEEVTSHVVDLVRRFEQDVAELRRRAEVEATGILAEARTEAARMRIQSEREEQQARAQSEELLRAARAEADRLRAELEPMREATLKEIRAMRDRLAGSLRELDRVLDGERSDEQVVVLGEAEEEGRPERERAPIEPRASRSDVGP